MTRSRRILVYGFGPYRNFHENITAKIIKSLPPAAGLTRVVFPVRFNRAQFMRALQRHKPDIVLGLGQCVRSSIEFETRAANRKRTSKKTKAQTIRKNGPRWLPTSLNLKIGGSVKRSKNAGDYVCNYSMYVMLDQIRRAAAKTQFGFLHVPHDLALDKAVRVVVRALKQSGLRSGRMAKTGSPPGSKAGVPSPA